MKWVSAEEAVSVVKSDDRVFLHSAAATPQQLVDALVERANDLRNVELTGIHTEDDAPYIKPEYSDTFKVRSMFVGGNIRESVASGEADYVPVFLSEVPGLFRKKILPLNVAMIQVSPPDKHGYCSLGVSVDVSRAAVEMADHVIAQVNPNMPRTHGDGIIHTDQIEFGVEVDDPLYHMPDRKINATARAIGRNVADLIEDGSCLQMGIGAIPDAVLAALHNHKDLGVHTEMFAEGVLDLVEEGVINGRNKRIHPGKLVASFLMGSDRLYNYVDDNPLINMLDVAYVNDTAVIRRNPKVVAINSAIEVDITGQVCADSIGTKQHSGVGGQMDFMRGASLSPGGKPIIALPSTTKKGDSRIASTLKLGADVVTTRAHVHYIVTEYGVADLYGKSLRERAKALIKIAHPDHREELEKAAFERYNVL